MVSAGQPNGSALTKSLARPDSDARDRLAAAEETAAELSEDLQIEPPLSEQIQEKEVGPAGRRRISAVGEGEPTPSAIRNKVVQLAGPALVEMMFSSLIQVTNMIMVGHVGPAAVAAVGLTNQPVFFALSAFQSMDVGATALVARFIGSKKYDEASNVTRQILILNVLLALVLSVVGYYSARDVLIFMGAEPDVLAEGTRYFQIIMMTLSFNTLSMSLTSALRGAGDTRTPMRVNMVANILVVVLGYPLIYGKLGFPAMGVLGAAVAAGAARFIAFLQVLRVVTSGRFVIKIGLRDKWHWRGDLIKRMIRIGLPSAGEQFVMRGGVALFTRAVAGLGTEILAAHQIALNVLSLSFMPGQGFAIAATALVGQNLGAKRPDWAEKCGWETRRLGLYVASMMGVVFFVGAPLLMRIYTNDAVVIAAGAVALRITALAQPGQSTAFVLAGGLRGAGDTTWPLVATFIGVWGFRLALGLIFVEFFHWGLPGAWVAMFIDQQVRSLVIYNRFKSGKWKLARA